MTRLLGSVVSRATYLLDEYDISEWDESAPWDMKPAREDA